MSALRIRLAYVGFFLLIVAQIPWLVLWYGIPWLWQDGASELRRCAKTIWTGKTGPWKGCVW